MPQLHSVAHPVQQVAPLSQHIGVFPVEHHAGEVAGRTVSDRVVLPTVAAVAAHQQGAVASTGPDGALAAMQFIRR